MNRLGKGDSCTVSKGNFAEKLGVLAGETIGLGGGGV